MPGPVDSGIVFAFEVFKKNSEMQKRIVVLGGVGFIGSHLCRRLLDAGHEVFCIDVRDITNAPVLRGLLKQPSLRYIHHNIIHPFGIRCDEIYNLAAPTMVRYSKALPVETLKVSMLGSIHALDTARSEHARVVLGSTGHVYGLHKRCGENLSTQRIIAEGKRAAEALHRAYRADYGLDTRIARIFNTYGSGADLLDQRVVVKMIVAALQGHEIVVEGSGEQTRTFCWIDDLVDGLVRLMEAPAGERIRTVDLGSDHEISILALAEKIVALCGSRSRIVHTEPRSDELRRRTPDLAAARSELGWRPQTTLADGLKRTIAYVEKQLCERAGLFRTWVEINN